MAGIDTSAFTEEAYELLSELEDSLLELEESPDDQELIGRVFRAMHTIKGSGAMFGFDSVSEFTHEVETVFDQVRGGSIPVSKPLIDLTLAARDQIRALLDAEQGGEPANQSVSASIIKGLRTLTSGGALPTPAPDVRSGGMPASPIDIGDMGLTDDEDQTPHSPQERTYRIFIKPDPHIFATGTNPLLLLNELQEMGRCRIIARTDALPDLGSLPPEECHTAWDIYLTTEQNENAIQDVFIFVEDECELTIRVIEDEDSFDTSETPKKLGEILVERGDVSKEQLSQVLQQQEPLGARLVKAGIIKPDQVKAALTEQQLVHDRKRDRQKVDAATSVRVPADKLDSLVDLVGELVTVQARLNQTSATLHDHNLQLISEEVERLTSELRDNTMSIRMLPIGSTFNKFKRLVRDLSTELGKQVEMTTAGAETELDKTVIDQLNDPLVHIIRNSIDHGIESPGDRQAVGKTPAGTVHLIAEHSGANVLIRVLDDGKGLNPDVLRAKALERGLIAPDQDVSDKEAFNFIFAAGFSTAKKVTNVSGRGVGMDVVRKSIDALRGAIDVHSELGKGTTITLKLPLTLAIIEGLRVEVGGEYFILPLSAVEECVELSRQDVKKSHGRHVINVRDEIVPYIRIRERFQMSGERPDIEQIVIVEVEDSRVGFVVDSVIGQHQTVIKSLGKSFAHSEEFSGATILGDGTVALILDLQKMVRYVEEEETNRLSGGSHGRGHGSN
jgi:two-component system chemotaxis sensor kinase CheA